MKEITAKELADRLVEIAEELQHYYVSNAREIDLDELEDTFDSVYSSITIAVEHLDHIEDAFESRPMRYDFINDEYVPLYLSDK